MTVKEFTVLFDTNAYRQFVSGKTKEQVLQDTKKLRAAEAKKSIHACGVMVVALEMLGNLVEDENGFNYADCLNGLLAMISHCLDEEKQLPHIVPHADIQIARSFFNTVPVEMENQVHDLIRVATNLRINREESLRLYNEKNTFSELKDFIDNTERQFADTIVNLIKFAEAEVIKEKPNLTTAQLRKQVLKFIANGGLRPVVGGKIILSVMEQLQLNLFFMEFVNKAKALERELPLTIGFMDWVCYKVVEGNIDMQSNQSKKKRWNWYWDFQVAFLINEHPIDERETILVTSDGDLIQILKDYGYGNKVLTITEYLKYLNVPELMA